MIQKTLEDKELEQHLTSLPEDARLIFTAEDNNLRGMVIGGTAMVNAMGRNHGLGILESLILGQAYIAAGLMTMNLKGRDRLSIDIGCSGPIQGLSVEADASGNIRGYLKNVPIPITEELNSFDLSPFFGAGLLTVNRFPEGATHPFTGTVHLAHGNIGQDIAYYYLHSEQTKTAVEVSIQFDTEGRVIGAGGLFLQALPGCSDAAAEKAEHSIHSAGSIGNSISRGIPCEEWLLSSCSDISPVILEERPVQFYCACSKERFSDFLRSMKGPEKKKIQEEGPFPLITTCHNCGTSYEFDKNELQTLI